MRPREEAASRKRSSGESSARGTSSSGQYGRRSGAAGLVYMRHRAEPPRTWFWFWLNLFDLHLLLDHRRFRNWATTFRLVPLPLFLLKGPICIVRGDASFLRLSSGLALLDLVPQGLEIVCETRQQRGRSSGQQETGEGRLLRAARPTVQRESGRPMLEENEGLRAAREWFSAPRVVARWTGKLTRAIRSRTASGESIERA